MSSLFESKNVKSSIRFWLARGALTGAIAGLVAANIFIFLLILAIAIVGIVTHDPYGDSFGAILFFSIYGQLVGTLPAILIGALSGLFTGLCFYLLQAAEWLETGRKEGLIITLVLSIVLLWMVFNPLHSFASLINVPDSGFFILLSLITLLYWACGVWGGGQMVQQFNKRWGN